jgi:hypothetical protein
MSDGLAARVLDSGSKVDRPAEAFQLSELYQRLSDEVWSELGHADPITSARRELQREYIGRLAGTLLRPSPFARADARGLARVQARALATRLEAKLRKHGPADAQTRVHLAESLDTLRQALAATIQRQSL